MGCVQLARSRPPRAMPTARNPSDLTLSTEAKPKATSKNEHSKCARGASECLQTEVFIATAAPSPSSTPSPAPLKCPQRSDHATATPPHCVENWPTPPATRNLHHASRSPRAASARAHQRYQHASLQPWRPRFVARRVACDSLQRLASLQPLRAMPRAAETRAAN